jgi:hypothetical protein
MCLNRMSYCKVVMSPLMADRLMALDPIGLDGH